MRHCRPPFCFTVFISTGETGLQKFKLPAPEGVPEELIASPRRTVEAVFFAIAGALPKPGIKLSHDPAIDGEFGILRIKTLGTQDSIHLGKARGIPELGAEIAIPGDTGRVEFHIPTLRRHDCQGKAQCICTVFVDQFQGIDDIALRLGHFLPVLVANKRVDVNRVERLNRFARIVLHEMKTRHHHPRNPEEDHVKTGYQHIGLIILLQLRRFLRPS